MGDKHAAKLITLAQTKIDEPVLRAAVVTPKGQQGANFLGGLAGLAIHSATNRSTAFGDANLFAITESALHAFTASHNFTVKVKEPIGAWSWGSFGASTAKGKTTQFLYLGWDDGSVVELEVRALGANAFQGPFVDEVVRRAAEAGARPPLIP
jgi:hypothetical protein